MRNARIHRCNNLIRNRRDNSEPIGSNNRSRLMIPSRMWYFINSIELGKGSIATETKGG